MIKVAIITLFPALLASAWETDSFSTRVELKRQPASKVKANLFKLNDQSNKMIENAIDHFNKRGNCHLDSLRDVPEITTMIKNSMGGGFISGALEIWAADTAESGMDIPPLSGANVYNTRVWQPDPAMNLAGHIVGTDKLGHFVDQGYELFEKLRSKPGMLANLLGKKQNAPHIEALEYGEGLEEKWGAYGLSVSGIKSYGDMAANYAGMRFYINLLEGNDPHLRCDEASGKYLLARPLNWADYTDDSLDEGINCSLFQSLRGPVTPALIRKFRETEMKEMNSKGKGLRQSLQELYDQVYNSPENKELKLNNFCPVEDGKCDALTALNCANYFISPSCYNHSNGEKTYTCVEPGPGYPVSDHAFNNYTYPSTPSMGLKSSTTKGAGVERD